jgi:hypothetical protein
VATVGLHAVTVAGVDISCLVDTVAVHHGRDEPGAQPEASSITVEFTTDADPLPPEVEVGAAVVVTTTTTGNPASTRFTGRVSDLALGWDDQGEGTPDAGVGQLVAVGALADLGRRVVGDAPFPQELDGARVSRVMSLAGITLDPGTSDPGTVQILPRDIDSQPALGVAQGAASSASGVVWETRAGEVRYADAVHRRGVTSSLTLDACDILVTPSWRRTIEGLVNQVSIGYGPIPSEGEQPRYVNESAQSVSKFGRYNYTTTTELAALADAQAFGDLLLARNSTPVWVMASLPVDVKGLDDARYNALLALDMHSLLTLTGLPAIGTAPTSANLWVEGWHETLGWDTHEIELVVSGYCRTSPAPYWDDVDPGWLWGGGLTVIEQRRNLITNPSFEAATTNWYAARGTLSVDTQPAIVGSKVLGYTSTDGTIAGGNYLYHTQTVTPVTVGRTYTYSVYLQPKSAAVVGTGYAWFQWWDASNVYLGIQSKGPSTTTRLGAWTRMTVTGTAPPGAATVQCIVYPGPAVPVGDGFWLDGALLEASPLVGDYFDGSTPDTAINDYTWTGTPNNSPSTLTSAWAEKRRNLATNPSSEPGGTMWPSNNSATQAASDDTTVFRSGTQSRKSVPAGASIGLAGAALLSLYNVGGRTHPVIPGLVYTHSLYVRHNIPTGGRTRLGYAYLDAANAIIGATTYGPYLDMPTPDVWVRVSQTLPPAPANAATFRIIANVYQNATTPALATDAAWADDCLVEQSATVGTYFDGNTPDPSSIENYAWMGAPNNSVSTYATTTTPPGGLPPDLTWDGAACLGPPINVGRWDDQPATLRWDQVPPATVWDTYTGM